AEVQGGHLRRGSQVGGGGRAPAVDLLQGGPGAHRGDDVGQRLVGGPGTVDGAGGHQREAGCGGQLGEGVVAGGVERVAGVGDLDGDVVAAEVGDELVQGGAGRSGAAGLQRLAHPPFATAGEHQPLAAGGGGELGQPVVAAPLLPRGQV